MSIETLSAAVLRDSPADVARLIATGAYNKDLVQQPISSTGAAVAVPKGQLLSVLQHSASTASLSSASASLTTPRSPISEKGARSFGSFEEVPFCTVLHIAAQKANPKIIEHILAAGADVNALDHDRKPPLAYVPPDAKEVRDLLLRHGAVDHTSYFTDDSEEPDGFIDKSFLRRVFVVFLLPMIVLLFSNGVLWALQFVGATIAFYYIAMGYFCAELTIKPTWYKPQPGAHSLSLKNVQQSWGTFIHNPKKDHGLEYQDVSFKSDKYTIRGWYVPGPNEGQPNASKMGLVFVHGGGRDRRAWLQHLPIFHQAGYSCLLFDMREHGLSDGAFRGVKFGMYERFDVRAAALFMRERYGFSRIAVLGTSIGAASAIMGAALDSTTINVIVAENPMMTCAQLQANIIDQLFGGYFHHSWFSSFVYSVFKRVCSIWLNIMIGNKPSKSCQSMHVVGKLNRRPIFLLHGTNDDVVPYNHSQKLYALASEPKELWIAAEAAHTALYSMYPEEFKRRVIGFLKKYEDE